MACSHFLSRLVESCVLGLLSSIGLFGPMENIIFLNLWGGSLIAKCVLHDLKIWNLSHILIGTTSIIEHSKTILDRFY